MAKKQPKDLPTRVAALEWWRNAVFVVIFAVTIVFGVSAFQILHKVDEWASDVAKKVATDVSTKVATDVSTKVATDVSTNVATDVAKKQAAKVAEDVLKDDAYKLTIAKLASCAEEAKKSANEAKSNANEAVQSNKQLLDLKKQWDATNYPKEITAIDNKLRQIRVKTIRQACIISSVRPTVQEVLLTPPGEHRVSFSLFSKKDEGVSYRGRMQTIDSSGDKKLVDGEILGAVVTPIYVKGTSEPECLAKWSAEMGEGNTLDLLITATKTGNVQFVVSIVYIEEPQKVK
jgi:hypothetical protein